MAENFKDSVKKDFLAAVDKVATSSDTGNLKGALEQLTRMFGRMTTIFANTQKITEDAVNRQFPPGAVARQVINASQALSPAQYPQTERRIYQSHVNVERRNRPRGGPAYTDADIATVDIETTGLNVRKNQMVSVATQRGSSAPKTTYLVPTKAIDPDASAKNRFTVLEDQGRRALVYDGQQVKNAQTQAQGIAAVRAELQGMKVLMGYNINRFDLPTLARSGVVAPNTPTIDLLQWARNRSPGLENYKLSESRVVRGKTVPSIYERFTGQAPDPRRAHEAGYDVTMTRQLFAAMKREYGVSDINEIIAQSRVQPEVGIGTRGDRGRLAYRRGASGTPEPTVTFGRFAGEPLQKMFETGAGREYVQYLLDEVPRKGRQPYAAPETFKQVLRQARSLSEQDQLTPEALQTILQQNYPGAGRLLGRAANLPRRTPGADPLSQMPAALGTAESFASYLRNEGKNANTTLFPSEVDRLLARRKQGKEVKTAADTRELGPAEASYLLKSLDASQLHLHDGGQVPQQTGVAYRFGSQEEKLRAGLQGIAGSAKDVSREDIRRWQQDMLSTGRDAVDRKRLLHKLDSGQFTSTEAPELLTQLHQQMRVFAGQGAQRDLAGGVGGVLSSVLGLNRLQQSSVQPLLGGYRTRQAFVPGQQIELSDLYGETSIGGSLSHLTPAQAGLLATQLRSGLAKGAGQEGADPLGIAGMPGTVAPTLDRLATLAERYALTGTAPRQRYSDVRQGTLRVPFGPFVETIGPQYGRKAERSALAFLRDLRSGTSPVGEYPGSDSYPELSPAKQAFLGEQDGPAQAIIDAQMKKIFAQALAVQGTGPEATAEMGAIAKKGLQTTANALNKHLGLKKSHADAIQPRDLLQTHLLDLIQSEPETVRSVAEDQARGDADAARRYLNRKVHTEAGAADRQQGFDTILERITSGKKMPKFAPVEEKAAAAFLREAGFRPEAGTAPGAISFMNEAAEDNAKRAALQAKAARTLKPDARWAVEDQLSQVDASIADRAKAWNKFLGQAPGVKRALGEDAARALEPENLEAALGKVTTIASVFNDALVGSQARGFRTKPGVEGAESLRMRIAQLASQEFTFNHLQALKQYTSHSNTKSGQLRPLSDEEALAAMAKVPIGEADLIDGKAVQERLVKAMIANQDPAVRTELEEAMRKQGVDAIRNPGGDHLATMERLSKTGNLDDPAVAQVAKEVFAQVKAMAPAELINLGLAANTAQLTGSVGEDLARIAAANSGAPPQLPPTAGLPVGYGGHPPRPPYNDGPGRDFNDMFGGNRLGVNYRLHDPEAQRRWFSGLTSSVNSAYGLESSERQAELTRLTSLGSPRERQLSHSATSSLQSILGSQTANYSEMAELLGGQSNASLKSVFGPGFDTQAVGRLVAANTAWKEFAGAVETIKRHSNAPNEKDGFATLKPGGADAIKGALDVLGKQNFHPLQGGQIDVSGQLENAVTHAQKLQNQLRTEGVAFTQSATGAITGGNAESRHQGFLDRFKTQITKLWAYMAGGMVVYSIIGYVQQLSTELLTLGSAAARIQGVLGGKSLSERLEIKREIIAAATDYGSAVGGVAQSLQVFTQAGFGRQKGVAATRAALAAEQGAGIDPKQATEFLIASNALYDGQAPFEQLVDKLSRVEGSRAISAQDLAVIQQRVGSLSKELQPTKVGRIGFDDIISGAGTALVEQTRVTGDVAATSLRFMLARLASPRVVNALQNQYGVRLGGKNPNEYAPLSDILQRLAQRYGELKKADATGATTSSTQFLATFAGARQINAAAALFDRINDVMLVSADSAQAFGETMRRVATQMDTMPAQLSRLHAAFIGLINSLGGNGLVGKGIVKGLAGTVSLIAKSSESLPGRIALGGSLGLAAQGIAILRSRGTGVATTGGLVADADGNIVPGSGRTPWSQRPGLVGTSVKNVLGFGSTLAGVAGGVGTALAGGLLLSAGVEVISLVVKWFTDQAAKTRSLISASDLESNEFFKAYRALASSLNSTPAELEAAVGRSRKSALERTEERLGYKSGTLVQRLLTDKDFKEPRFRETFYEELAASMAGEGGALSDYFAAVPKEKRPDLARQLLADTATIEGAPGTALNAAVDELLSQQRQPILDAVKNLTSVTSGFESGQGLQGLPGRGFDVNWTKIFSTAEPGLVNLTSQIEELGESLQAASKGTLTMDQALGQAAEQLAGVNKSFGGNDQAILSAYNKREKKNLTFEEFATATGIEGDGEQKLKDRTAYREQLKRALAMRIGTDSGLDTKAMATMKVFDQVNGQGGGSLVTFISGLLDEMASTLRKQLEKIPAVKRLAGEGKATQDALTATELARSTPENLANIIQKAAGGRVQLKNRLVQILSASAAEQGGTADLALFNTRRGYGGQDALLSRQYQATMALVDSLTRLPFQLKQELANIEASPLNIQAMLDAIAPEGQSVPGAVMDTRSSEQVLEGQRRTLEVNVDVLKETIAALGGNVGELFQSLSPDTLQFILGGQTLSDGSQLPGLLDVDAAELKKLKTPEQVKEYVDRLITVFEDLREAAADAGDALRRQLLYRTVQGLKLDARQAIRRGSEQAQDALGIDRASMATALAATFGRPVELEARLAQIQVETQAQLRENARPLQDFLEKRSLLLAQSTNQGLDVQVQEASLRYGQVAADANTRTRAESLAALATQQKQFADLQARRERTVDAGSGFRNLLGSFENLSEAIKSGTVFQQAFGPLASQVTQGSADQFTSALVGPQGLFADVFPFFTDPIYEGARTGTYQGVLDAMATIPTANLGGPLDAFGSSGGFGGSLPGLGAGIGGASLLGGLNLAAGLFPGKSRAGGGVSVPGLIFNEAGQSIYAPPTSTGGSFAGFGSSLDLSFLTSSKKKDLTPKQLAKLNALNAVGQLAGQLGGAALGGGGKGAEIGAGLGSAAGMLIPIPVVGPLIGGLLGGLLGGLFDSKPKVTPELTTLDLIERNTRESVEALKNQVDLMTLDDRLLNVPSSFVVPDYRPFTVGSGGGMVPGTAAPAINIVINDARDPDAVAKAVSTELARSMRSSGLYVPSR